MVRKRVFRILATATSVFHMLVCLALLGGVIGVISGFYQAHPILLKLNTALVYLTLFSQIIFLGCPLVTLENLFRAQYDPNTRYYGSFIVHIIFKYTKLKVPVMLVTVITYLIVGVAIAGWFIFR